MIRNLFRNITAFCVFIALIMVFCSGCISLPNIPQDNQIYYWEQLSPTIKSKTVIVSSLAFQIESVKPHKEEICSNVEKIKTLIDAISDDNINFEKLDAIVMSQVQEIQNPTIRAGAMAVVQFALQEATDFAKKHFQNYIQKDEPRVVMIIANAVVNGLQESCSK